MSYYTNQFLWNIVCSCRSHAVAVIDVFAA